MSKGLTIIDKDYTQWVEILVCVIGKVKSKPP